VTQSQQMGNDTASLTKLCVACNQRFAANTLECPQDNCELLDLKSDPMFGRKIAAGKYKVIRELGRGGMGAVYLAEDAQGKQVAIKLLKAQLTDRVSAARFQEEATAWSRLQHPHSATLLENLVDGKQPCLVVEYVHGKSLAALLKQEGPLSLERCQTIFTQVMDTIQYAHDNGLLHRDLKPGNIFLVNHDSTNDFVKVVDFMVENLSFGSPSNLGLADLVSRGPVYMSPEQCQGKKLSAASDIYSLGVAFYEALTGKPPFKGRNSVETASMHISTAAPPFNVANPALTLPPIIEQVVLRALEKDPSKRYESMSEFKSILTKAINEPDTFVMPAPVEPPKAAPAGTPSGPEEAAPATGKVPVALIAIIALALAGIAMAVTVATTRKPTETISFSKNSGPTSDVVEGTVYFASLDPLLTSNGTQKKGYRLSEICLRTDKGDLLKLTSNIPRDLHYPGPLAGDRCKAAVEGTNVAKLKMLEADTNIKLARETVLNFAKSVAASDYAGASQFFAAGIRDKAGAKLKDDWSGITPVVNHDKAATFDSFSDTPLPQAIKILDAGPKKIELLLNEATAFDNQNAIDKFILIPDETGSWKIEGIQKRVPRKEWHS
jgi:eukaryotic-like serine/threonine-protein kinase